MVNYILRLKHSLAIAFWKGESGGTKFSIELAKKKGISVYVYYYKKSPKYRTDENVHNLLTNSALQNDIVCTEEKRREKKRKERGLNRYEEQF